MIKMMEFFFIMKWDFLKIVNIVKELNSRRLVRGEEIEIMSIKNMKRIDSSRSFFVYKDDGL